MTSDGAGTGLREQLGGSPDPDFQVRLLPGWERHSLDDADLDQFDAKLKARLMKLHRPDLYAQLRGLLRDSYDKMRKEGAVAFYAVTGEAEDAAWIPGSMVVSHRRSPTGGSLDEMVTHAIKEYGAGPLFGDKRFIRFEREKTTQLDDSSLTQTTIVYLTPIPGSGRRRALQFTATFGRSSDAAADDPMVGMYKAAFDAMVSTLQWVPKKG